MKPIKLIFAFVLLAISHMAMSQERTLVVPALSSDTSIVRSCGPLMLVYNHSRNSNCFMLLSENSTLVNVMYYWAIDSVADMEIWGDTVFFCGRMNNGSAMVGFVGCFNITQYPNAYATVYQLPQFKCVNKLTATTFTTHSSSATHLMMTAARTSGGSVLFDVKPGVDWLFAVYDSIDDDFLDVEQTQSYVIATSRKSQTEGYVWALPKSTSSGNFFFDNTDNRRAKNPPNYPYPYLIASHDSTNDDYVVSSRPNFSGPLHLTNFGAIICGHTYTITASNVVARDMAYNPSCNMLDVLVDNSIVGHTILHIPAIPYPFGGSFTDIVCNNIPHLASIDKRSVGSNIFVATGTNANSELALFLYGPYAGSCSQRAEPFSGIVNALWTFQKYEMEYFMDLPTIAILKPDLKAYKISTTCNSKSENE